LKRKLKYTIFVLLIGFVGMQFIPTNLNQSDVIPQEDIINYYKAPKEVAFLLKNSCYDCHSDNTDYQWFNKIKPIFWVMENHIKEGKEDLNFNEFASYSRRRQKSKLKSIISQIEKNEMPLKSYNLMHKSAILDDTDKTILIKWIEKLKDSI